MDEFFLEFKFDEFDTMKANTKQHMDDELALLDKFKTHYDPASEDTKDYLESCKARNITLSGDLRDRVPMIARMFNPDIQDDTSLMEKFKLHLTQSEEDLPALKDSTPCFVIPHVSLRVNFLIGCNDYNRDSLIFGDICDVIISSFLVMHYFDIGDSSSIHRFQHIFKGRFNNHKEFNGLGDYGHVQSMVAFTSGTSVSLKALFLFDQYREELGVSNVLYFGMYSEDVKRLQSESIKHRIESVHNKGDFPIESSDRQMNIKPMNAKDKFKQFQKFMCKWYQDQTDAHEECSNSWKDKKYKYL